MAKHKRDIRDLSYPELTAYLGSIGEASFRAGQIFEWLYQRDARAFDRMSDLSSSLRGRLKETFVLTGSKDIRKSVSDDGTTKALFELEDGQKIETVLIPTASRVTLCVSTQAGCKFGCRFCASGIGGWKRDLTCAEILSQVLFMRKIARDRRISHIVFMGVGEPLDNYDNVLKAVRTINSPRGMNIAARRITISTCGLIPQIKKLAKEGLQIELAVSLHGFSQESRDQLMPVNRKYPVKDLIAACRDYVKATKRQVTFEYILIKDLTCTPEAARNLSRLLKGLLCKVNLIPCNPVETFPYKTPSNAEMLAFKGRLKQGGILATIRTPRGRNISAACGQLRHANK